MDYVRDLVEETKRRFAAMSPSSRLMAALLLAVVCFSAIWTLSVYDSQSMSYLGGAFAPSEMQRIQHCLDSANLGQYEVVDQGTRIKVPSAQRAKYMKAMAEGKALPESWAEKQEQSLVAGMFESSQVREWRYQMGKERAFEDVLRKRPQVSIAYVEFDQAKAAGLAGTTKTCCIHVEGTGRQPIGRSLLQNIAESATKYFAGLTIDNGIDVLVQSLIAVFPGISK